MLDATRLDSFDDWYRNLDNAGVYFFNAEKRCLYFVNPFGVPGVIDEDGQHNDGQKWTLTENEDGTVTVEPSIHDTSEGGYHGWLRNDVWTDSV